MSLTKRHKRRLKEISRMIDSTIIVRDEMVEINLEYAREIEEFIELIKKPKNKMARSESTSDSTAISTESHETTPSDSTEKDNDTSEHQTESNYEPTEKDDSNVPPWAKSLWKRIAMKCHPDRLNFQDIPANEIAKRQQYMFDSRAAYESEDWNRLLHIGVNLEEFVNDLPSNAQFKMLETEYNKTAAKVTDVQESIAWQWGNNWSNFDIRTQIINACCQAKGIQPPPREKILELLIKFEAE